MDYSSAEVVVAVVLTGFHNLTAAVAMVAVVELEVHNSTEVVVMVVAVVVVSSLVAAAVVEVVVGNYNLVECFVFEHYSFVVIPLRSRFAENSQTPVMIAIVFHRLQYLEHSDQIQNQKIVGN